MNFSSLESRMTIGVIALHALIVFLILGHSSRNQLNAEVLQAQLISPPAPNPATNAEKPSPAERKKEVATKPTLKTLAPEKNTAGANPSSTSSPPAQGSNTPSNVDISQLVILYKPDTEAFYPSFSKRVGEEGSVEVRLQIDENGLVQATQIALSSGSPRLDKAATELASRIRFKPYTQNGVAVKVNAKIGVKFKLRD